MDKITTQPYKGSRDFFPEDMRIRNYIFDIWRDTALSYGYEEYDFPFLEPFELYAAKSGAELIDRQLYFFEDRGGRKVAIRPEKTPSLARMIAAKIKTLPRPIRWFNIGNCWRYEKPQKGRGREFFQFDCDIFGVNGVEADAEVFSIPVEVMKKLGAKEGMFELRVCDRKLAEEYLRNVAEVEGTINQKGTQMNRVSKIVDEKAKITQQEFEEKLEDADLSPTQIEKVTAFITADLKFLEKYENSSEGAKEVLRFFELINEAGYEKFFKFSPDIMRQFDYSTGIVIEQFDLNSQNNRSMFGGERYDDLVNLFSNEPLTGTGFAMGDVTLIEFLRGWDLIPDFESETEYLVTLWPENSNEYRKITNEVAKKLRDLGKNVIAWCEDNAKLDKQLKFADRKGIPNVIILGETELKNKTVTIKNMKAKKQETKPLEEFLDTLS
jgi:histidyl-tRNA synthetase